MSEKLVFRTLLGTLALVLVAIYAIAVTHDNGRTIAPAPPQVSSDGISQFKWGAKPVPAPQTAFEDATGKPVTFADFGGKVVLVNLWATWCAPCLTEMPALARLADRVGDKDFMVVAVSEDRDAGDAKEWLEANGLGGLTYYHDPKNALLEAFKTQGLPTSILLNRKGEEIGRLMRPAEWDGDDAQAIIAKALGGPATN